MDRIGLLKFTSYEAQGIQPLVANSPFMGWVYEAFSVTTFSTLLGVVEVGTAVLRLRGSAKRPLADSRCCR